MKNNQMKLIQFLIVLLVSLVTSGYSQNIQKIDGDWKVLLLSKPYEGDHDIKLPGSLAEAKLGFKTEGSDFGVLTPEYRYIGVAKYHREINIPKEWKDKEITVFLERVLWESRVFIDNKEYTMQDGLGTAHIHKLGKLPVGKHTLTIQVNNNMIHNIGDKGHAYGEYTQGIWNGIVGRMELIAKDPTYIDAVRTFSDIDNDRLGIELNIHAEKNVKSNISINIVDIKNNSVVKTVEFKQKLEKGENRKKFIVELNGALTKWNEFNPTVYNLVVNLDAKKYSDKVETEFGYLKISHNKHQVTINNKPVFLRGNLDCVHFPLTGYPSADMDDWIKIFETYKAYGLNHVRYHSWCPPEAAFKAANRVGIYIQAEASIWIDWWMSSPQEKALFNTLGFPKGLGKDSIRDVFVKEEMNRVVDVYGNNPSFTMFCIGNELGNSDFDVMEIWIDSLKKKDPRRLYAISTARQIRDVDDYNATHYIAGVGSTRGLRGAGTDWDFEKEYSQMNIPIIAHEIGQWPVYPSWTEIDKYTGVLKAKNFEEFREVAKRNGIEDQSDDFRMASGALNQIMYKYETESFLRTKSCAGVQLLSMQDYQGQGEALIGWLDAFWQSKGITTPEKFREHFNETVPLLRIKKFVWNNEETLNASVQLSHYGQYDIDKGEIVCTIKDEKGKILSENSWNIKDIKRGSLNNIGTISLALGNIKEAKKLTIYLALKGTEYKNEWNVWVYPTKLEKINNTTYVANQLDKKAISVLKKGGNVLLNASNLGTQENSVGVAFYPLYWSYTFFPGQGRSNLGTLVKDKHPALENFPTDKFSDWQWEPFNRYTKGFILNELPEDYKPIVQVVDDFHRNNKEGVIFEFKVGKGKLLISGYDFDNENIPNAKQLKYSLLKYTNSSDFNPSFNVDEKFIKELLPVIPTVEKVNVKGGFKNVILKVNSAENITEKDIDISWDKSQDNVEVSEKGTSYRLWTKASWKDDNVSAWVGDNTAIEIQCPKGILGSFYVKFNDWNNKGREGILEFEGRKVVLGPHNEKGGKWVKFHVMREDSNDGRLILKTKVTNGGNLMIDEIVLTTED